MLRFEDLSEEEQQRFLDARKKSQEFMDNYEIEHECCPKCGSTAHSTTLVAYIFNHDDPESYKDENDCVCSGCGDRHITHDRVPKT